MSVEPLPLARSALGVALTFNEEMREKLADVLASTDRRVRDAYFAGRAEGFASGQRGWKKLVVAGVLAGWLTALGVFAFVLSLA